MAEETTGKVGEPPKPYGAAGYGDQDENGIDLSLLRENPKLTPTERLEKNRRLALSLRRMRPKPHG
jgi:hypothetical protein